MIPDLTSEGVLPPGVHDATVGEVRRRFGTGTQARRQLMKGLSAVIARARRARARDLYLNGSFVTSKKEPVDWDAVLVFPVGCNTGSADAIVLADRDRIRRDYDGDLFTVSEDDPELLDHFVSTIFGTDRHGVPKGLVRIHLTVKEEKDGPDQE